MRAWLLCLLMLSTPGLASERVEQRVKPATLILWFKGGTACSGTVVGANVILTATHCFGGGDLLSVNMAPAKTLARVDDGKDHTLIRVDLPLGDPIRIAKESPAQGDSLFLFGNPSGNVGFLRRGYVIQRDDTRILLEMDVHRGDSGAGLFNERGELAGMVSAIGVLGTLRTGIAFPIGFTDEQRKDVGL